MRFWELKEKEVINCKDGKRLGYVADLEFDPLSGKICRVYVPGPGKFCGCFGKTAEYVIGWNQIVRIGTDILLVDIDVKNAYVKVKE
ncbi:MAG: YlmC/YmxH family sporulation protein [Lachnospiraceae bacterium]|nr:YlmC/YmxH family sporulation protein [Lachnospiraceae bacterium]